MVQRPVRLCLMPANKRPLYLGQSCKMMQKEMQPGNYIVWDAMVMKVYH